MIFALRCSHTNIESYWCGLLARTLRLKQRTSHIIGSYRPTYWNLVSVGSSLCTHNGLLKAKILENKHVKSLFISCRIKKKVVGDDTEAPKKPQWGIPRPPVILALLFMMMTMTTRVRQDWSDLLRAAYNRKCAASCAFKVVLIIVACTCLKM